MPEGDSSIVTAFLQFADSPSRSDCFAVLATKSGY
jgi:hypothetical protein